MGHMDNHHVWGLAKRDRKEKNYCPCYSPLKKHDAELLIFFSLQRGIRAVHLPKSFLMVAGAWLVALLYILEEKVSYVYAV